MNNQSLLEDDIFFSYKNYSLSFNHHLEVLEKEWNRKKKMIVLGKNKVDERYNILEDGTIVDLNGNVQELKIAKGRSYFKSIAVHQIQVWTNYGWRDSKIYVVHHLDENPLNNSLSNLIYLTRSEHNRIHKKGAHWSLSLETREKMSRAKKGNLSLETREKMSRAHKGLHWFNDGVKSYRCKECPPGCVKGRLF